MSRSVRMYVVICSAVLWSGLVAAALLGDLDVLAHPAQLAPLLGMAVAVEALVVRERNRGRSNLQSFSATTHIAAAVIFGPAVAALLAAVGVVVADGLQGAPRRVVLMNSAMFGCAIWCGGVAFELAGGTVGAVSAGDFVPLLILISVRFVVNEVMLGIVVTLDSRARFTDVIRDQLHGSLGSELGQGCLGVLLAYVYTSGTWVILPFLIPLLAALYRAEANFERLKSETADVLHQLATAIDERDSNTADHTRRVADYVEQFAGAILLGDRETERLVEAARYHDLGKIVVDVATLSKAGRLDEEELRAIRRHPRLSARLLSPFHSARKTALYAELHHERYDGGGYYGVHPQDIPIEAHVLIAADSFDAMTSNRPYRPGISIDEAAAELEANAGTQFHPLVARAFAAMVRGEDVAEALGHQQLLTLRMQFSRIPLVELSWLHTLPKLSTITVGLASVTLICSGINPIPRAVIAGAAAITLVVGSVTLAQLLHDRRRKARAFCSLKNGVPLADVLESCGIQGWVAWLVPGYHKDTYEVHPLTPAADEGELAQAASLALRPTVNKAGARLQSGTYAVITEPVASGARLAVGMPNRPGRRDLDLIEQVAGGEHPLELLAQPDERRSAERRHQVDQMAGVISIELGVFDNVRRAAGQLFAQQVVKDAVRRTEAVLCAEDEVTRIGDDRIAVLASVADQKQLDAIAARIVSALHHLPVPRGAAEPRPRLRTALMVDALADRDFAEMIDWLREAPEPREVV